MDTNLFFPPSTNEDTKRGLGAIPSSQEPHALCLDVVVFIVAFEIGYARIHNHKYEWTV